MEPVAVRRELRLERLETTSRHESDDTCRVAATRSSPVEWTRNAGACVTPFISQHSLSLLGMGLALAPRSRSRITPPPTRVLQREATTTASDRGAFTRGGAAVRREAGSQAGPARVGTARTVTPAFSSPSPAATAWRSGARLRRRRPPAASLSAAPVEKERPRAALNLHAQGACGHSPDASVRFLRVHWSSE